MKSHSSFWLTTCWWEMCVRMWVDRVMDGYIFLSIVRELRIVRLHIFSMFFDLFTLHWLRVTMHFIDECVIPIMNRKQFLLIHRLVWWHWKFAMHWHWIRTCDTDVQSCSMWIRFDDIWPSQLMSILSRRDVKQWSEFVIFNLIVHHMCVASVCSAHKLHAIIIFNFDCMSRERRLSLDTYW